MISTPAKILSRSDLLPEYSQIEFETITLSFFGNQDMFSNDGVVVFVDRNGDTIVLKNRYVSSGTNTKKVYSKHDVQKLVEPLLKQIEFYHEQYLKCRRFIRLPLYKQIFNKWAFIKSLWKDEEESDTIIENLSRYKEQNPEMFEFLKNWYDRKSPKNN